MLDPTLLTPEKVRPLRHREYEKLVDLGAFENERVELLRGQLVTMSPQGASHATVTARLAQYLIRAAWRGALGVEDSQRTLIATRADRTGRR